MSDTIASLNRKIDSASDLQSVVGVMKALAAANIGQYLKSVEALGDYSRTVELGLSACLRASKSAFAESPMRSANSKPSVQAIVFGSDQGLVGQFNDKITNLAWDSLKNLNSASLRIWTVGLRVHERLLQQDLELEEPLPTPSSVKAITQIVGQLLIASQAMAEDNPLTEMHLFYNRPVNGPVYESAHVKLLPLDTQWLSQIIQTPWPSKNLPEVIGPTPSALRSFIREHLFISIFKACAESLASENASRLAAMQRADKNIEELLTTLQGDFHRLRQSSIDEELFDVISGFEALKKE